MFFNTKYNNDLFSEGGKPPKLTEATFDKEFRARSLNRKDPCEELKNTSLKAVVGTVLAGATYFMPGGLLLKALPAVGYGAQRLIRKGIEYVITNKMILPKEVMYYKISKTEFTERLAEMEKEFIEWNREKGPYNCTSAKVHTTDGAVLHVFGVSHKVSEIAKKNPTFVNVRFGGNMEFHQEDLPGVRQELNKTARKYRRAKQQQLKEKIEKKIGEIDSLKEKEAFYKRVLNKYLGSQNSEVLERLAKTKELLKAIPSERKKLEKELHTLYQAFEDKNKSFYEFCCDHADLNFGWKMVNKYGAKSFWFHPIGRGFSTGKPSKETLINSGCAIFQYVTSQVKDSYSKEKPLKLSVECESLGGMLGALSLAKYLKATKREDVKVAIHHIRSFAHTANFIGCSSTSCLGKALTGLVNCDYDAASAMKELVEMGVPVRVSWAKGDSLSTLHRTMRKYRRKEVNKGNRKPQELITLHKLTPPENRNDHPHSFPLQQKDVKNMMDWTAEKLSLE